MALTKLTADVNIHQSKPDTVRGDAAATKAYFDKAAADIKTYVNDTLTVETDALDAQNVKITSNQTVAGVKIFPSSPVVPTPTTDMQASTKKYVDDTDSTRKTYVDDNFTTKNEITNDRKLSATGNFTGTWQGFTPTQTDPGIQAVVDSHTSQLADMEKYEKNIIRDYGAINNTTTYPLSNKYNTLALAQAAYPNAGITALTQELNWAAFQQAFYDVTNLKYRLTIPTGSYYIKNSLTVGASQTGSVEYGSGVVIGAGMQSTQLLFDIQDTIASAIEVIGNTQKISLSNFNIKNITPKKGIGVKVSSASIHVELKNILTFNNYIGFDLAIYVGEINNCIASYGSCGFKINNGTACTYQNCYGTNNTPVNGSDTADYAGCNWFISGISYSSFNNCASDSGSYAYKIKSVGNLTLTFNQCGMEGCTDPFYIDAPKAIIAINSPSIFESGGKIAHVENALSVVVNSLSAGGEFKVTRGANVGVGVVKFVNTSQKTGNAALASDGQTTIDRSIWGINDLAYDVWSYGANDGAQEGRGIFKGNTFELQLMVPGNGDSVTAEIKVMPKYQYGSDAPRAGYIYLHASNDGGYVQCRITKLNTDLTVTSTDMTDGRQLLISPFIGLVNSTLSIAYYYVDVVHHNITNDHNLKNTGTYTGRPTVKVKGIDY